MLEEWKDIPSYEGRYQASNLGRIRSLLSNKILSPGTSYLGKTKRPYYYVPISKVGSRGIVAVHRIIAATFLGKWSTRESMVDHIDGNSLNNNLENLRYLTNSQNCLNRQRLTGIHFHKQHQKWNVRATRNQKRIELGLFETRLEAEKVKVQFEKENPW